MLVFLPMYAVVGFATGLLWDDGATLNHVRAPMLGLVLIVVLVPLQCAAEELVFRGLLGQVIGAWIRNPVAAIIIPVVPVVLGHQYNWSA